MGYFTKLSNNSSDSRPVAQVLMVTSEQRVGKDVEGSGHGGTEENVENFQKCY
jgi:hypothetical protein